MEPSILFWHARLPERHARHLSNVPIQSNCHLMPDAPPLSPVNREAVKVLAKAIGVREAARRMGLSEDRVRKWSQRDPAGPWGHAVTTLPRQTGRPMLSPVVSPMSPSGCPQTVTTASKAMADTLDSLSKRGRLAYLAAGVAVGEALAAKAEEQPDAVLSAILPEGQNAKAWSSITGLAAGWSDGSGSSISVNLLIQ